MAKAGNKRIKVEELNDEAFEVGQDNRGFVFLGIRSGRKFRVIAGCQSFTMLQARRHWSASGYIDSENTCGRVPCLTCKANMKAARERLPHINRMLDAIEAEAIKRGWLRRQKKAA